jgi:2,3-dihydroxyphenylpropionate 1,2-dioxygenase
MAEIVGVVGMSHSPSWDLSPQLQGPGSHFVSSVMHARALLEQKKPDALVVFGPDHFRNFFYDVLPQFCIGIERVDSFGDYSTPKCALPCAADLGRAIVDGVMARGFDPAVSLNMRVDHGHVQPYAAIDPSLKTPIVPIMINSNGAPRPSLKRCAEFGSAVGESIRNWSGDARVALVSSGGLSHWLPPMSADDDAIAPETREYIINGRPHAVEYNAAKERSSIERRKAKIEGRINQEWDRWFLDLVRKGDFTPLFPMSDAEIERNAGNGAHELRSWVAAASAWGKPIAQTEYEPVPHWITGMDVMAAV